MKHIGKHLIVVAMIAFMLRIAVSPFAANGKAVFQGERSITYAVDISMLSNYFNGGRSALDVYMRASKPNWLRVAYQTEAKNLLITLSFPFDSKEDYSEKIFQMSGREAVIFYTDSSPISYAENIVSIELLNFLKAAIRGGGYVRYLFLI